MERLTKRDEFGNAYTFDSIKAIQRLAEYEDMEESGRLFKMPMKIGDAVYFILQDENDSDAINGFVVSHPHKVIEVGILGFWTAGIGDFLENADFTPYEELGEKVFLTRAKAESMLKNAADKVEGNV